MKFVICNACGRHSEAAEGAEPEAATAALEEFAAEHVEVQTFDEAPEGWPRTVEGVRTNGHYRVVLQGKPYCGGDAETWPCPTYAEEASQCPANAIGLAPEPRT